MACNTAILCEHLQVICSPARDSGGTCLADSSIRTLHNSQYCRNQDSKYLPVSKQPKYAMNKFHENKHKSHEKRLHTFRKWFITWSQFNLSYPLIF